MQKPGARAIPAPRPRAHPTRAPESREESGAKWPTLHQPAMRTGELGGQPTHPPARHLVSRAMALRPDGGVGRSTRTIRPHVPLVEGMRRTGVPSREIRDTWSPRWAAGDAPIGTAPRAPDPILLDPSPRTDAFATVTAPDSRIGGNSLSASRLLCPIHPIFVMVSGMEEQRALHVVDALRERGIDAHLAREGVYQIGVRVVLHDGREAVWDTDDTINLEAEVMQDGTLVGFVPAIAGSENFDVDETVDAIARADYDQPVATERPTAPPPGAPLKREGGLFRRFLDGFRES
jgi:hypothetical protein